MTEYTPHALTIFIKDTKKLTWESFGQLLSQQLKNKGIDKPYLAGCNVRNFATGHSKAQWFWPVIASLVLDEWKKERASVQPEETINIDLRYAENFSNELVEVYKLIEQIKNNFNYETLKLIPTLWALIKFTITKHQEKYEIEFPGLDISDNQIDYPYYQPDYIDHLLNGYPFINHKKLSDKLSLCIRLLKSQAKTANSSIPTMNFWLHCKDYNFNIYGYLKLNDIDQVSFDLHELDYIDLNKERHSSNSEIDLIKRNNRHYVGKGFSINTIKEKLLYISEEMSNAGVTTLRLTKPYISKDIPTINGKSHKTLEVINDYYTKIEAR